MGRKCQDQLEGFKEWAPTVWRILMEQDYVESHPAALEYALLYGVVGVGWRLDPGHAVPECLEEYRKGHEATYKDASSPVPLALAKMKPGDLVWFMAKPKKKGNVLARVGERELKEFNLLQGAFTEYVLYIGLVVGFWEYQNTPLAQLSDMISVVPILHLRAFTLEKSEGKWKVKDWGGFSPEPGDEERVGQIAERFEQRGTISRLVNPEELTEFSKRVWYQLVYRRRAMFRPPSDLPPFGL